MKRLFATLLLLSITAIWGWTFVVVRDAVTGYGVLSFLALRFSLAALAMAPIAIFFSSKGPPDANGQPKNRAGFFRKGLLVGGGIGFVLAGAYYCQTEGLVYTSPSYSGLITGLFIVFGPIVNRLLFGIRTSFFFWAAICVAVFGLILLTGVEPVTSKQMIGNALTLGCAILFGLHIALLDQYASGLDTSVLAFSQITTAAIIFWIFALTTETFALPSLDAWWAIAITGILATALGYFGQTLAQQQLPAVRIVIILSMEPVFAALFGVWLGGDVLTAIQVTGAILMVVAITSAEIYGVMSRRNGNGKKEV